MSAATERRLSELRRPKPCPRCGGTKPSGRGRRMCDECATHANRLPTLTLAELVADQTKDLRMGHVCHRQRFGWVSRDRARTRSMDAMRADIYDSLQADEWSDPVFDEVLARVG